MSGLAVTFDEYERAVIADIAHHIVSPNKVRQVLAAAGKPVEKILSLASTSRIGPIRKAGELVTSGIERALDVSIRAAARLSSDEAILEAAAGLGIAIDSVEALQNAPLQDLDRLADFFDQGHALALGAEGAILGAATTVSQGIPFAQILIPSLIAFDVSASMTLLSRHVGCVAASYGYSPRMPLNRIHMVAAMAPPSDSPDEGYFTAKIAAVESIQEAGAYMARTSGAFLNRKMMGKEAPQLVRLLNYVSGRLGIVLTQKELGMLIPLAGALLNGGLNVAFQKLGHTSAKDYFRILYLEKKYGSEVVRENLENAVKSGVTRHQG